MTTRRSTYIVKYPYSVGILSGSAHKILAQQLAVRKGHHRLTKEQKCYYYEGVDRGGGGTGVEGAESGVEGAESGLEGAGSGGRGGGKGG